ARMPDPEPDQEPSPPDSDTGGRAEEQPGVGSPGRGGNRSSTPSISQRAIPCLLSSETVEPVSLKVGRARLLRSRHWIFHPEESGELGLQRTTELTRKSG